MRSRTISRATPARTTAAGTRCAPRGSPGRATLGLFAAPPALPPRSPGVPAWDDVDPARRALYARYMELYAAVVDNMDQNIGRLMDTLEALGRLDNTLVILTSDNGANGIGGIDGAANNLSKRLTNAEDPAWVRDMLESGRLGAADSWPAYPLGWTDVSSTPFRLYKTTTMNGGIRVPLVMQWPAALARRRALCAASGCT